MAPPRRRLAWGALLLPVLAGLAAPQAVLAQDTVTLVSNRHYDGHHIGGNGFDMNLDVDVDAIGRGPNTSPRAALRFRTGPNPEGYLLDEFVIWIPSADSVGSSSGRVYTDDGGGRPVTQIATLSGSPREGLSVLSSASGVALSPDTWYVVRLDFNQASNVPDPGPAQVTLQYMKLGDYVGGSLPGWQISSYYRSWRARNSEWVYRGYRVPFEIRGRVQGTNSAPEFGSARRTIDFRPFEGYARDVGGPVAATDADGDPLAYSLSGADAASFTIDRWSGQIRTRPHAVYGDDTDSAFKIRVTADDRRGGTDTADVSLRPCDPCGAAGADIPGRPRHLFATVTAGNRIQLNWDPPAIENPDRPVTGYHVQWAWNASRTNTVSRLAVLAEDTGNTETSYTHTVNLSDLPPDHLFGYRVRAINRSGKGLPSEFVKLTPVVDREAPRTRAARLASDGRRLEITFNEPLRNTDLPDAGQFTVFADSIEVALSPPVWEGTYRHQLRLTVAEPVGSGRTVLVSYQASGSGNAIQDLAGNRTGSFTHLAVTNDSEHTERWFQSAQVPANGQSVVLRFDRALDDSAGATPPASAFTVTVSTEDTVTTVSVGTVTVSGSTVSLSNLSRTIRGNTSTATRTVRVSYKDPGGGALQSTDGLYVPSFEDAPATNNSMVEASDSGVGPEPLTAAVGARGDLVSIRFDEDINSNAIPGADAWNIAANGSDVNIGGVARLGVGTMVFRNINPVIRHGQTVTVSYTKPTTGNVLEDTDGNEAESFADFPVDNNAAAGLLVHDAEGTEGTDAAITFTVTLAPAATRQVTVQYATADGTATQPADYTSTSGTLTFAAGDTTKTVSVPIVDDGDEDDGEAFTLTLSNPSGTSIVVGTATGTIHNTEPGPAPHATGVELVADDSGDGAWTPGETVEVRLTFGAAVTVADGTPTVGVTVAGEAGTLDYASGSGSATLVFSRAVTEADGSLSQIAVMADSLSLNGATIVSTSSGVAADLTHDGTEPSAPTGDGTPPGEIGARFNDVPAEHGNEAFEFEIAFTRTLAADFSYQTLAGSSASQSILSVTNASVTGARRVNPSGEERDKVWAITIEPADTGDIVITLPASAPCGEEHAMCSVDDEPMSTPVRVTVPTTAQTQTPPPTPFKVSVDLPAEHDGTSEIRFEVSFNKEPADYSYTTLRNSTLKIRQGGARLTPKVKRLNAPANDRWEVKVAPGSKEDLTVLIGPFTTCSDAGAVCTADDEVLSNKIEKTIEGAAGALGCGCAGRGGRRGDGGLRGDAQPGVGGDGAGGLRDERRVGEEGHRLHVDIGHAGLQPRRDGEDGVGAGARRRARRGRGDVRADALEPARRQCVARRRHGDRHHREHRRDAEGVARALRAHRGKPGGGRHRGPDGGRGRHARDGRRTVALALRRADDGGGRRRGESRARNARGRRRAGRDDPVDDGARGAARKRVPALRRGRGGRARLDRVGTGRDRRVRGRSRRRAPRRHRDERVPRRRRRRRALARGRCGLGERGRRRLRAHRRHRPRGGREQPHHGLPLCAARAHRDRGRVGVRRLRHRIAHAHATPGNGPRGDLQARHQDAHGCDGAARRGALAE